MEQLFFAGKAYLKINSLVKTPLHEFMAVERSGLWAPGLGISLSASFFLWCPIVAEAGSVAKVTAEPGSNSSWYVPCNIYKVLVLTKVDVPITG